jgi:hypothetical protein
MLEGISFKPTGPLYVPEIRPGKDVKGFCYLIKAFARSSKQAHDNTTRLRFGVMSTIGRIRPACAQHAGQAAAADQPKSPPNDHSKPCAEIAQKLD